LKNTKVYTYIAHRHLIYKEPTWEI